MYGMNCNNFEEYINAVSEFIFKVGISSEEIPYMINAYKNDIKEAYLDGCDPRLIATQIIQNF